MFLKLRPFLCSLPFIVALELMLYFRDNTRLVFWIVAGLFIFSLREGKVVGKSWRFSILPVFFTLSASSLLYLITLVYEQQIFIFLAWFMHYLALFGAYRLGKYDKDQTAKGMNMAATFATLFFTYTSAYGLYLNFLIPLYILMLYYFLVTVLISYQYFSIIENENRKTVWIYSFILGLVMMELAWTINFWPFGYLTTGAIALILYHILWDITQSYFLRVLNKKRIILNATFFALLVFLVLITSKWFPIVNLS